MAHGDWDDGFHYFPPSRPRQAKGGIKARSRRGSFGGSWWAKRWVQVLEGFQIGARLSRGRAYARQGQVTDLDVGRGVVRAKVQGSRARPYTISIKVKVLTRDDWRQVADVLGQEAIFAASLLAGKMPQDIEKVFAAAGVTLFPSRIKDLETECSCPDWSNPCKHIAAVFYLLGEEFDRDPFLIFRLRGLDREDLVSLLADAAAPAHRGRGRKAKGPTQEPEEAPSPEPLPSDPAAFWSGGEVPGGILGEIRECGASPELLRRLAGFPFWRGGEPFLKAMEAIYRSASWRALNVAAGRQMGGDGVREREQSVDRPRHRRGR